jgi:transcriptional regulator with XRE-family HTH domain
MKSRRRRALLALGETAVLIGQNVRSLRRSRRLSQAQLAKRAQLSTGWIRSIEAGAIVQTLAMLVFIAHGLRVPIARLFSPTPPTTRGRRA